MKKILNAILFTLSFIWQAPQSLIGLFMLIYFKLRGNVELLSYRKLCFCYKSKYMSGGISLGNFAFVSEYSSKNEATIAHEQLGHTWDSKLMGPLYLLIIGLPSILNAAFDFTECYYDFFTEKLANFHAGVIVRTNSFGRCYIDMPNENDDAEA